MKKRPAKQQEELWSDHVIPTADEQVEFTDDEWHQPASDGKGHSVRLSCRVPPPVARVVESLIAGQRFPYSTADDLIRHALIRHLFLLHRYDRRIPRTHMAAAAAILRMVQDYESQIAMRDAVMRAVSMLQELAKENDWAEIRRRVAFVDATLEHIPDTSPWKKKFVQMWSAKSRSYREMAEKAADAPQGPCVSTLPEYLEV